MISSYRHATEPLSRAVDVLLLVARAAIGVLFIDHGLQKYSADGGVKSFEGFLRSLDYIPFPGFTSQVIPALEVVGGALLIAGVLTRVIALVLAAEMVYTGVIVKLVDLETGVVSRAGAGAEVDFAFLVVLLVVLVLGPGRASVDAILGLDGRPLAARQ